MLDLVLTAGAVAVLTLYARGLARTPATAPSAQRARVLAFAGGFAVLLGALASPFEQIADTSLTAHMTQHVLLLTVAPPLLVASRPGAPLTRGLPAAARPAARRAHRALGATAQRGALVPVAVAAWIAVMALWHLPGPFDAAVHTPVLHGLEHATFLAASLTLWWAVAHAAAHGRVGVAVLGLFASGLACTALGALLVLAPSPWYPAYAHGGVNAALADQQLAGIVMWGFANLALVVATAVTVGVWLTGLERRSPSRVRARSIP